MTIEVLNVSKSAGGKQVCEPRGYNESVPFPDGFCKGQKQPRTTPCGEHAPEGPRKKNDFLKKWVLTNQSRRDRIHTQKQAGIVSPGHKGAPARIVSVSVRGLECWIMYGLLCMIFFIFRGVNSN